MSREQKIMAVADRRGLSLSCDRIEFTAELVLATDSAGAKVAPKRIQVFREGQWVTHPAGKFQLDPSIFDTMVANKAAMGTDPPLDREHESVRDDDESDESLRSDGARGWATAFLNLDDPQRPGKKALFADVRWTPAGKADIEQEKFRYVSGGFFANAKDRETGKPIGAVIDHIAICIKPYITGMQPLTNSNPGEDRDGGSMSHVNKKMIAVLGLTAAADEAEVLAAIERHEPAMKAGLAKNAAHFLSVPALAKLGLSASATVDEVSAKIVTLGEKAAQHTELEKQVAELVVKDLEREVDDAIASFKLAPAEREEQLALAKSDRALFRRLLAKREALPPATRVKPGDKPRGSGVDAQSAAVAAYMASHKGVSMADAIIACAEANPALFPNPLQVEV